MKQKSMILNFPKEQIEKPLISELIKNFNVSINILEAHISPAEGGKMFVIMQADNEKLIDTAVKHIKKEGINVVLPSKNLLWDEEKCVDCGACIVHCYPQALFFDEKAKLVYDDQKCIACGLCVPACSYGAIETVEEHLKKERSNG
jgi:L-aspartate semialdehyde sulfurtransferase ferredoxin